MPVMRQRVAFRVDASTQIGSGHVVRCLALADVLAERGAEVTFICRAHEGNLEPLIRSRGFRVVMLMAPVPPRASAACKPCPAPHHSSWLGASAESDASQCRVALEGSNWDWIVVDHYALDAHWEAMVRPLARRLMVIDDLADRDHECDLLVDQNLGRQDADYRPRVPAICSLLTGPSYALLRPEFAGLRAASLARPKVSKIGRILVSMGGVDQPNATGKVLDTLATLPSMVGVEVLVVMGQSAPWLPRVREQVARLHFRAEVRVNITDMAQQMSDCDLSIGAAGGTAWERCCLGLPSVLVVLADNQAPGAHALGRAGAACVIESVEHIPCGLPACLARLQVAQNMAQMRDAAARITDGLGAQKVAGAMETLDAG